MSDSALHHRRRSAYTPARIFSAKEREDPPRGELTRGEQKEEGLMDRGCRGQQQTGAGRVWAAVAIIHGLLATSVLAQPGPWAQTSGPRWQSRRWGDQSVAPPASALVPVPPAAVSETVASGAVPDASPRGSAGRTRVVAASHEQEPPHQLPQTHGQIWREYDIRGYTERHAVEDRAEQTIVDWILRETGTEMWFSEPLGVLSAERHTLRVYHTPDVQAVVREIVERFQRAEFSAHVFGVRMVTLASPNWRSRAIPRLTPVQVQTPGVEAWLVSHEDAALVLADLQKRTDFREHNSPNLLIRNGDVHEISRTRPVAYLKNLQGVAQGAWGGPSVGMGQVEEGFSLRLSPLMGLDGRTVDAVIKIESHQVENLKSVNVPAPTTRNPREMATIKVPQTSSWRLHERFHWPADRVLLISCGVVSSPAPDRENRFPLANLRLLPTPPRRDALLFVEAKGRAASLATPTRGPQTAEGLNYRGRY